MKSIITGILAVFIFFGITFVTGYGVSSSDRRQRLQETRAARYSSSSLVPRGRTSRIIPDWAEGMTDREITLEGRRRAARLQRSQRNRKSDTRVSQQRLELRRIEEHKRQQQILAKLLRRVEQLEKRVEQLETK